MEKKLTHIDEKNQPAMVDVSGKTPSLRTARAQALVELPPEVWDQLEGDELQSPKGPVFQTAIIAGTMAAKKTGDLIPFCHPIGLDDCKITITPSENGTVTVQSSCRVHERTGVEMEAMTAVSVAALTIYDMCKGLSREIVIRETRLLEKTGGRNDYTKS